jgi:hypothetical protein
LSATQSAAEVVARIEAYSRERHDATVVGVDFDESDWRDGTLPTRAQLDAISKDRPLYARRVCCHVGVANTALLEKLRSPDRFIDRESGRIVEDAVFEANASPNRRPPRRSKQLTVRSRTCIRWASPPSTTLSIHRRSMCTSRASRLQRVRFGSTRTSTRPSKRFETLRDQLIPLGKRGVRAMGHQDLRRRLAGWQNRGAQ